MSCERFADAVLEHALGEPASAELTGHLSTCEACRAGLEQERRLIGRIDGELRDSVSVSPSPVLLPRVRARVFDAGATGGVWRPFWLVPVAAGAVALAAVVWLRQPPKQPAIQARSAALPAVAESPRPVSEARVEASEPVTKPVARRPRPARAKSEPEVLVPPGEAELVRRFVVALRTGRVDASAIVAGETLRPPADLTIPLLDEIPPLEVKPLPSGLDPEGVNR